jgi:hypothetical protein
MAEPDPLPLVQHDGYVSFLSGGVGLGQSTVIRSMMRDYPLSLEFAGSSPAGNEYPADIPVRATDTHSRVVPNAVSGPSSMALIARRRARLRASAWVCR